MIYVAFARYQAVIYSNTHAETTYAGN